MRLLFFLFILGHTLYAQVSKTTSYTFGSIVNAPSVAHVYTTNHYKYIATLQNMPTGAISRGINVVKFNECDELEWKYTFNKHAHPMNNLNIVQEQQSDNIFITGLIHVSGNRFLYVLKLDPNGEIIFSKYYDFGQYLLSYSHSCFSNNNGIVVSAKYSPLGGGNSYTTLLSIDSNGNLIRATRHYHTYTGISSTQISDDTYIHRSEFYVYEVNTNGQINWAKKYNNTFGQANAFNIVKQNDGYVFPIRKSSDQFIVKLDLNGNLLWKTDLKPMGLYSSNIESNSKQELVLCNSLEYNGVATPLLITYDSNGVLLKEEVVTDLNNPVIFTPYISKSPVGHVNLTYITNQSLSYYYLQNIEHITCKEPVSIPEVENLLDITSVDIPAQSFNLPLVNAIDVDLQITDLYLTDSVRCIPNITTDTIYTTVFINCGDVYTYKGNDENTTYYWPHDGSTDAEKTLDTAGVYEVQLDNCFSRTIEKLTLKSLCGCQLKAPNIFTPNNDLINDVFEIIDECGILSYNITIYNRWGKRMFTTKDIHNSWDGTYNGKRVQSDVYYYKIEYTPISADAFIQPRILDGVVTVVY